MSEAEARRLARAEDHGHAVICPPFPFLASVEKALKHAALGAQDVFWKRHGAYTGEVSAPLLKKLGASYVIVGHSERRMHLHETDEEVNRKTLTALVHGLMPIVCVGEPKAVRKRGIQAAKKYVGSQIKKGLRHVHGPVIVAYEPIWAIGTGVPDKPEQSAEMITFIRKTVHAVSRVAPVACLYGGSVNPKNAHGFLSKKEIDGALVGGASLNGKSFQAILRAAN